MPPLETNASYRPTGDQPKAIEELSRGILRAGERYQTLLGATGTGKTATMAWIDRAGAAPGARHRAQQDARRAALQRVPRVLPGQRGRVLRLLLRLLPARGVRPAGGPLHREGLVAERRHRPAAPRGDVVAPHPARRDRRRVRLLHLRPRLAGGVRASGSSASTAGEEHDRDLVLRKLVDIQYVRNDTLLGRGRFRVKGDVVEVQPANSGDGVPHLVLRRRGRGRSRTSTRSPARCSRSSTTSTIFPATQYVTSKPTIERAVDEIRHELERAGEGSSRRRASCSRRTGSGSAPSTTSR